MDWTDDVIERLKALWTEGHSTAEIGRRMGISKNAVVGKAHRLMLLARPSPIHRAAAGEAANPVARRVTGPTLAPMPAVRDCEPPRVAPPVARPSVAPPPVAQPAAAPALRAVARPGRGRLVECCWPIGEPGTRSFRFCDADSVPGKPYCPTHAALAYVKVRDRREDAA